MVSVAGPRSSMELTAAHSTWRKFSPWPQAIIADVLDAPILSAATFRIAPWDCRSRSPPPCWPAVRLPYGGSVGGLEKLSGGLGQRTVAVGNNGLQRENPPALARGRWLHYAETSRSPSHSSSQANTCLPPSLQWSTTACQARKASPSAAIIRMPVSALARLRVSSAWAGD